MAFLFGVASQGASVGHVMAGTAAYGYDILEAGTSAPPAMPSGAELQESTARDLGAPKEPPVVEDPSPLYLGYGLSFVRYRMGNESYAFDLQLRKAVEQAGVSSTLVPPAVYSQRRQAVSP